MTSHRAALAVFVVLLAASATATADVVDPPPESCPPASQPSFSHSGPLCAPTDACTTDADCTMGTCMEIFQCIEMRGCGGLRPPDAGTCEVSDIVGACGPHDECSRGACFTRHVCSATPIAPRTAPPGGCACAIDAAPRLPSLGLVVLALGVALLRARRRP